MNTALEWALPKRFFDAYQDLHNWAAAEGRKLFHITFKFKNTKYLNFRVHHNFRGEDFVGQIRQLGHSCSFGCKATRKYKILLHLQLTKPNFGNTLEEADP